MPIIRHNTLKKNTLNQPILVDPVLYAAYYKLVEEHEKMKATYEKIIDTLEKKSLNDQIQEKLKQIEQLEKSTKLNLRWIPNPKL